MDPRTATRQRSIWHPIGEIQFQQAIALLWTATHGHPKDPQKYSYNTLQNSTTSNHGDDTLPLAVELELANGLAFIASARKGPESVTAVVVETPSPSVKPQPRPKHPGLRFTVAANDGVSPTVREKIDEVIEKLQNTALGEMTSEQCQYAVLDSILLLNRSRIHNRLRGKRSPTLLQDSLSNLLKSLTADSQAGKNSVVLSRLQTLYDVVACYHARIEKLRGLEDVKKLVVGCHDFFKATPEGDDMKTLLRRADIDVDASRGDSCLRQIGKIANYYHVAESFSMIASNQEYRQFCINLSVRYLTPYKMVQSPIPAVDKCGRDCRVHAEVQLVVDIDLNLSLKWRKPRTIGSSKAPCFLCELFIGKHGEYFVPRTHGKLTPRWTIPNLDQFTKRQVSRYRNIIGAMMREFQSLAKIPHPRRLETAMSWQSLSQLTLAWYLKPSAMHRSSRRHLEQAVQTLERRSKESATTKSSSIRSEDANSVLTTIREEGIRCHAFEPYSDTKISEQKRSTGDPECDGPWRTNPGNTSYCSSPGPSTLNLKHGISNSFPSINTTHLGLQSKTSRSSGGRKRVARSLTNLDSKVPLSPLAAAIKSYRTTTGALNRTIEFRDLELFLETGPVAGVQTIVIPSPNPPSNSKDRVIVEVDKLTPGTSLDVDTDEDLNAPRMMFLTLRDGDGVERWWECHWKAVAQVR